MCLSGLCSAVRTVLIAWLQLFVADSGGVALMFAITVVPTIGVVGLAVDWKPCHPVRGTTEFRGRCSALAAVKTAADAFTAGKRDYIASGEAAAWQWFSGQSAGNFGANADPPTVVVRHSDTGFSSDGDLSSQGTKPILRGCSVSR